MRPSRLLLGVLPLLMAACAAAPGPAPAAAGPAPTSEPPKPSCVDTVLAGLDRRAAAGQLIVVGAPLGGARRTQRGPGQAAAGGRRAAHRPQPRGVAAVAARTAALQKAVTGPARLIVAADQEGGQVQTLAGPGFSTIPTAVEQGRWSAGSSPTRQAPGEAS